jgi:hypothetical protein
MNWRTKPASVALFAALVFSAGGAVAGRACEEKVVEPERAARAFDTAFGLAKALDVTGQHVVIIARRGQNLEKYGVTFSHAAFAVKEEGTWVVYHDLNLCGTAVAKLYQQGLAEFLADDLISQQVAVVAPEPWLQDRLAQLLQSKTEQFRMHETAYSAVAYPFATKYQNSDGWLLETYARAASEIALPGRVEAQAWLRLAGYAPSVIEIGALTRLGARMTKANVAFDDHPPELRWNGKITTNTGDAVLRFVGQGAMPQWDCPHGKFAETVCLVSPTP